MHHIGASGAVPI